MKKLVNKVIVQEQQRGLLYKNGKFIRVLDPGRYTLWGETEVFCTGLCGEIFSPLGGTELLLTYPAFADRVEVIDVADHQAALLYRNGVFQTVLQAGRHLYWKMPEGYTWRMVDMTDPMVPDDIPPRIRKTLVEVHKLCETAVVQEWEAGLLFVHRQLQGTLAPGEYCFWKNGPSVQIQKVDTRLRQENIAGQEVLTADKVTLRIHLVCHYRVIDPAKALLTVDDYEEQLHLAAQLALREYVGRYRLDEILENQSRDKMGAWLFEQLQKKGEALYLSVEDAGVRDIILPGEMREIMNTVLAAEKRAQANVITRREEVASTRSLLNTAKLMEENETLYRLKELEYLERICDKVGSIHLGGGADVLGQLRELVCAKASGA